MFLISEYILLCNNRIKSNHVFILILTFLCYSNLVLERLALTFFIKEFSEPVRFFVIPNLSAYNLFPYSELIKVVLKSPVLQQSYYHNSWFLFSVVSLGKEKYRKCCNYFFR